MAHSPLLVLCVGNVCGPPTIGSKDSPHHLLVSPSLLPLRNTNKGERAKSEALPHDLLMSLAILAIASPLLVLCVGNECGPPTIGSKDLPHHLLVSPSLFLCATPTRAKDLPHDLLMSRAFLAFVGVVRGQCVWPTNNRDAPQSKDLPHHLLVSPSLPPLRNTNKGEESFTFIHVIDVCLHFKNCIK
jgi:hypothetical protein